MDWSFRHARYTLILFLLISLSGQVKTCLFKPVYPDTSPFRDAWPPGGHLVNAAILKNRALLVFPRGTTAAAAIRQMGLQADPEGSGRCLPRAGTLYIGQNGWRINPMTQRERWVWRIPMDLYECKPHDLERIRGIGPSLAGNIYRYVHDRGHLDALSELEEVPGIGPGKLKTLIKELEIP